APAGPRGAARGLGTGGARRRARHARPARPRARRRDPAGRLLTAPAPRDMSPRESEHNVKVPGTLTKALAPVRRRFCARTWPSGRANTPSGCLAPGGKRRGRGAATPRARQQLVAQVHAAKPSCWASGAEGAPITLPLPSARNISSEAFRFAFAPFVVARSKAG